MQHNTHDLTCVRAAYPFCNLSEVCQDLVVAHLCSKRVATIAHTRLQQLYKIHRQTDEAGTIPLQPPTHPLSTHTHAHTHSQCLQLDVLVSVLYTLHDRQQCPLHGR